MMNTELIIKGLLLSWLFVNFTPFQNFLNKYVKPFIFFDYLSGALSCVRCLSFWFVLIGGAFMFNDFLIFEAISAAIIAYTYDRIINSFKIHF